MQKNGELSNPVIIGGVGGSGTRVVAEIISHLGYYFGDDLNAAKDNLLFLLLFKRPRWFSRARYDKIKIFTGLSLFSKVMLQKKVPNLSELRFLIQAVFEISIYGHNHKGDGRGTWPFLRVWHMIPRRSKMTLNQRRWGWKEPNSHIYLEYLAAYYSNMKYIHTIRHGLDMAFSLNQQQLYNWGPILGLDLPKSRSDEPAASLKYWLKSNRRAMEIGEKIGDRRFLTVNYDRLCMSPRSEIQKILSFLDIEQNIGNLTAVNRIPIIPKSLGRYRAHNISQFNPADLKELEDLGFSTTVDYL